jgi:hypothetical protein
MVELLQAAIVALQPAFWLEPESPVERVLEGDKREALVNASLKELGGFLARHPSGFHVAEGLISNVRLERGPRAETVYEGPAMRVRPVYVSGQPDHVEIVCNEAERKKFTA